MNPECVCMSVFAQKLMAYISNIYCQQLQNNRQLVKLSAKMLDIWTKCV